MAQPVQQYAIRGTGFQGLNTEQSPIGTDATYALRADNCVVDRVGRMTSREAFANDLAMVDEFAGPLTSLVAVSAYYGTGVIPRPVCTVANYNEDGTVSSYELGHSPGSTVQKCSGSVANNAGLARSLYVHFKDELFLFSKDNPFMKYSTSGGWSAVPHTPPKTDAGNIVDVIDGDIAISAYGRLWVSGVNGDYQTIYYSSLLREDQWYDGQATPDDDQNTAGIINVSEYWPVDFDQIVNIHAHNGLLIVYGRKSIIVYAGADSGDPAGEDGIRLQDGISNVGLVERDAICNIGTDVMFCDDTGVRSLGRVIQEKSNPIGEPSMNVRRQFMEAISEELGSDDELRGIRMAYFPSKSLAVCLFRSADVAYTFSTDRPSSTGGAKVTRWTDCYFDSMYFAEDDKVGRAYLGGSESRGLLKYDGYRSAESYVMDFESIALGATGGTIQTVIPKSIIYLVLAPAQATIGKSKWGFGGYLQYEQGIEVGSRGDTQWGVSQFGLDEYAGAVPGIWKSKVNTIGSGEFMRIGLEITINGGAFSVQEIAVNSAIGRIAA